MGAGGNRRNAAHINQQTCLETHISPKGVGGVRNWPAGNVKKASGSRKRECDGEDQETAQNKNPGTEITGLRDRGGRSEEHTSELQPLMRTSYAGFCLKKKTQKTSTYTPHLQKKTKNVRTTKA